MCIEELRDRFIYKFPLYFFKKITYTTKELEYIGNHLFNCSKLPTQNLLMKGEF